MQDSDFHPIFYIRADWADRGFGSYQRIYIYKEETAATFVFMCFLPLKAGSSTVWKTTKELLAAELSNIILC